MIVEKMLMFKSITYQEGGEFKTPEGTNRAYDPKYNCKFDMVDEDTGEVTEVVFKVKLENNGIISSLQAINHYQMIPCKLNFKKFKNNDNFSCDLLDVNIEKAIRKKQS